MPLSKKRNRNPKHRKNRVTIVTDMFICPSLSVEERDAIWERTGALVIIPRNPKTQQEAQKFYNLGWESYKAELCKVDPKIYIEKKKLNINLSTINWIRDGNSHASSETSDQKESL